MKCQSRNPNPMARLMLFPPLFFLLLLSFSSCPSRSTKHGIFWRFFSCCLYPYFTPVILLGELFCIAVCLMVTTINSQAERKPSWKTGSLLNELPLLFLLFFGKETNKWLPEQIQVAFSKRVDLSFTYSFLKLSIIRSLLKPRTSC